MESIESKQLSVRKCKECKASKDGTCFYAKAANRLDTICKACRKKNKKVQYQSKKIYTQQVDQVKSHVIKNEGSKLALEPNSDEFRNLVDAFGILLKIDRRLKGEE